MRRSVAILALVSLAACQREAAVPPSEENAQMDEAANLLDQAPEDLEAVDDGGLNAADSNRLP
jgi:predicted small lipoprotein YifL